MKSKTPRNHIGTNNDFERNSKLQFTSVWYNICSCEPRLMRGGATHPASAHRSARGAICAAVLASELADTDGLDYRKESAMKKKRKQQRLKILLDILLFLPFFLPFFLSFSLLLVYGFTERLNLWLIALSSFSWFLLTAVYVYILITNKKIIIKQDAFYKGKPITQNEATFFAYIFAVIFLALGTMLAIMLFRELCG
ncbi:MAG: hypothetical protein IKA05_06570 [Clostridia bacterium]|nr:hypothetical protein [Clostridia bacterium]